MLRVGAAVFQRLSTKSSETDSLDEVHVLNQSEQQRLQKIETVAIGKAALIGTGSALACAISWFAAEWMLGPVADGMSFWNQWRHYAVMALIVSIATAVEVAFLYWNALVAVHQMAVAAGLKLFDNDGKPKAVLNALVGAALELPNSREETLFAQPGREVSRWWLVTVAVLYRLKVTVTYYIAKALVHRCMGRVLVRWAIELVAIPVYAFWDGLVTFWVLRQARVCAMGPSCIKALAVKLETRTDQLSEAGRNAVLCAVGSTVARNTHLHPNIELFLRELIRIHGQPSADIDNSGTLLDLLVDLSANEQEAVLQVLTLSLILDGRVSLWERGLLRRCLSTCGRQNDLSPLKNGLKTFRNGQPLRLDELLPDLAETSRQST